MFIIRVRSVSKLKKELVVIEKGKALTSNKHRAVIASFFKSTNTMLLNYDLLWYWIGCGCHFSTSAYKLLQKYIGC